MPVIVTTDIDVVSATRLNPRPHVPQGQQRQRRRFHYPLL
jgi:hypothetical protein